MAASAPNLLSPLASPHLGSSDEADSASELASPALSGGGFETAFASSTTLDSYHDAKDARFLSTDTLAADEPAPELLPPWSVPASPETAHICRRAWDGASACDRMVLSRGSHRRLPSDHAHPTRLLHAGVVQGDGQQRRRCAVDQRGAEHVDRDRPERSLTLRRVRQSSSLCRLTTAAMPPTLHSPAYRGRRCIFRTRL